MNNTDNKLNYTSPEGNEMVTCLINLFGYSCRIPSCEFSRQASKVFSRQSIHSSWLINLNRSFTPRCTLANASDSQSEVIHVSNFLFNAIRTTGWSAQDSSVQSLNSAICGYSLLKLNFVNSGRSMVSERANIFRYSY